MFFLAKSRLDQRRVKRLQKKQMGQQNQVRRTVKVNQSPIQLLNARSQKTRNPPGK